MNEREWLKCTETYKMLEFLSRNGSGRKLRLFACGVCRQRAWHLLVDKRSRKAIEVAERYAEGMANQTLLRAAWLRARAAAQAVGRGSGVRGSIKVAQRAAAAAAVVAHRSHQRTRHAAGWVFSTVWYGEGLNDESRRTAERSAHLVLLRCVFGNPFRPVTLDRAWLRWNGGTIPKLAQAIYDERSLPEGALNPTRLAILADALEEAGCTHTEMLSHCRDSGAHVRGCWVVDAILRKH
jgi:hypothetical protein